MCNEFIVVYLSLFWNTHNIEFAKNANARHCEYEIIIACNWFGDYRGLRFCASASVGAFFYFLFIIYAKTNVTHKLNAKYMPAVRNI